MSYSISQANADLQAMLHGTNLNKVQGINNLHYRTARQLLLDIDPIETERKSPTTTPIFHQIYDYSAPADLKGDRIIDISPPYDRNSSDVINQTYQQNFDIGKNLETNTSQFTIQFNNAVKTIRIDDKSLPQGVMLDTCNSVTGWSASNTASNLHLNTQNYAIGTGSLFFDMNVGTGAISITESSQLDLSAQYQQSTFFYYLYLPSSVTSTELRFGSDASNYYSITNTLAYDGTALQIGWNLIGGAWLSATTVGSPDYTKIDYIYVGVSSATALVGIGVDDITSDMGLVRTLSYYSKYLFRDASTGAFQETVTDNSNLINLDTESYNIYLNLLAFYTTQQVQGLDAAFFDNNFFGQEYQKGKLRYVSLYKTQVSKPHLSYYTPQKGGYGKFLGRRSS